MGTLPQPSIVYIVSGGDDGLDASAQALKRWGKTVKHGDDVHDRADRAIPVSSTRIVIGHGDQEGTTVYFRKPRWASQRAWIFVGMNKPPRRARIYLYSCFAGIKLPKFLSDCTAVGHVTTVPMPLDSCRHVVKWFLEQVEELWPDSSLSAADVIAELRERISKRLDRESQKETRDIWKVIATLMILNMSLGDGA